MQSPTALLRLLVAVCFLVLGFFGRGAAVTLKTSDQIGTTSWTGNTNWSDNTAPSSANDYFTGVNGIRTPPDSTVFTNFAGKSLSIDPGGQLLFKHIGNVTNANLLLNGGAITLGGAAVSPNAVTNWGQILLNATTNSLITTDVSGRGIDLRSTIVGTGGATLIISNLVGTSASNWAGVTISGSNSFTNAVLIMAGSVVKLNTTNAFGVTNGWTTIAGNSTVDVNSNVLFEPLVVSGTGTNNGGAIINNGPALVNNGVRGPVLFSGNTTLGGNNRFDIYSTTLNASNFTLTKVGGNEIALAGLGNTSLGDIVVNAGKLTILGNTTMGNSTNTATINGGGTLAFWANGLENKVIVVNSGGALANDTSPADTVTNAGTVSLSGNTTISGSSSFRFQNGINGSGNLTKAGVGTLTLAGTNLFSGNILVTGGRLALWTNAQLFNAANIVLNSGTFLDSTAVPGGLVLGANQVLSGYGTVTGSVVVASGAAMGPGIDGVSGNMMVTNGSVTVQHQGALRFDLSGTTTAVGSANDLLVINGNLNLSGSNYVYFNIVGTNGPLAGPYTIIRYSGSLIGSAANLLAASHQGVTFDTSFPGEVRVSFVPGSASVLTWKGDNVLNRWDTTGTSNWLNGINPDSFYAGDAVLFDDTGSAVPFVNIVTPVAPSVVTVSSSKDYTFTNAGSITSGSIIKNGSGILTVATTNSYSGGTYVGGGTVKVGVSNALGAAGSTVVATNGGQVDLNAFDQSSRGYTYIISGNGPDGQGAIKNANPVGGILDGGKSGVKNLILVGDAALSPNGNRFDIGSAGFINGNGFKLTKNGANILPIRSQTVSNISEVIVNAGRVYSEQYSMQLTNIVTVNAGAQLGAYAYTTPGGITNSATINLNGGSLGAESSQSANLIAVWNGPVNVVADSFLNSAQAGGNSDTQIEGKLNGTNNLTVLQGAATRTVIFTTNSEPTYSGNITVNPSSIIRLAGLAGSPTAGNITNLGTVEFLRVTDSTYAGNLLSSNGTVVHQNGSARLALASNYNIATLIAQSGNPNNPLVLPSGTTNFVNYLGVARNNNYGRLQIDPGAALRVWSLTQGFWLGEGTGNTGEVWQAGGDVVVDGSIRIGHWGSEQSTYTMGGGTLTLPAIPLQAINITSGVTEQNGVIYVGVDGIGALRITNGSVMAYGLVMDGRGETTGTDTLALEGGRLTLGSGGLRSGNSDANTTYSIFLGGGTLAASADWNSIAPLTISGTNGNTTFDTGPYSITLGGAASGPGNVIKAGSGALVLNNSFGAETTTVTVANGTLGGVGTIRSAVTVQSGALLTAGTNGAAGTLVISNNATINGGLVFDLANTTTTGAGVNDLIVVRTNLTIADGTPFTFNFLSGAPSTAAPYTVAQSGLLLSGNPATWVNRSHYGATFSIGLLTNVQVQFSGAASNLTWIGDGVANTWDSGVALNWTNGVGMDYFGSGDAVTFDDSGSNNIAVNLSGLLAPGSITVNAAKDYAFGGSGRIVGSATLTKSGSGTLLLTNGNEFTGAVTINAGTVAIANDSSLGLPPVAYTPGKVVLNGGTLSVLGNTALNPNRGIALAAAANGRGTISVSQDASVVVNGIITNNGAVAGSLLKTGNGSLRLGGNNSYTGDTIVSQGTLIVGNNAALGSNNAVRLGDANTGSSDIYLLLCGTLGLNVTNPIVVNNNGSGQVVLGSAYGTATNPQFTSPVSLNRNVILIGTNTDRTTFAGPISGTGNITVAGPNRVTLVASNFFTGNISITNGQLQIGAGSAVLNVIPDSTSIDVGPNGQFWVSVSSEGINALTGSGLVRPNAPSGGSATLVLGAGNGSGTFSGLLTNNGSEVLHITKNGSGTQTLSGRNAYTGNTVVNSGVLALGLGGSISNSAQISVNTGGKFDASAVGGFVLSSGKSIVGNNGIVLGDFNVQSNATLSPNGFSAPGVLSFSNKLALDRGATINFNFTNVNTPGAGLNDLVIVGGDLVLNGPMNLNIFTLATNLNIGSYRLFTYGGNLIGNATNLVVINNAIGGNRYTFSIDTNTPGQVNLVVANGGNAGALTWMGSPAFPNWNTTDSNWFNGTILDRFFQADAVIFNDGAQYQSVGLPGTVQPASITVNASKDYTITGNGKISGTTGLVKNGGGVLTLGGTNDFLGGIFVNEGIFRMGNSNAIGNALVINITNGASFDFNGIPMGPRYTFNVGGSGPDGLGVLRNYGGSLHNPNTPINNLNLTANSVFNLANGNVVDIPWGGVLNGRGFKITKIGNGRLDLYGTVTNVDELIINEGVVYTEGGPERYGTNITVNGSGNMGLFGGYTNTARVTLAGGQITGTGSGSAGLSGYLNGSIIVTSNSSIGQFYIFTNNSGTVHFQINSLISGSAALTKTGTNTINIAATNTFAGDLNVSAGRLVLLATASFSNANSINVSSGAVLDAQLRSPLGLGVGQTLAGSGLVQGDVVDNTGSVIQPGGQGAYGTLTISNTLTLGGGGSLVFDLNSVTNEGGAFNDLLVVTNLTVSNPTSIKVNPLGLSFSNATYTLINYSGALTGSGNLSVATDVRGITAGLDLSVPGKVRVTISGTATPSSVVWLGDYDGQTDTGSWDLNNSLTWYTDADGQTFFRPGDAVTFDDQFNVSPNVRLTGTLNASSITVSSFDNQFTFLGSGSLAGGTLVKAGLSMLTIANSGANVFAGPIDLRLGTLRIGNGGNTGSLPNTTITNAATLVFNRSDALTVPNTIVGGGALVQQGPGNLTISGANASTYTGTVYVVAGTLLPGSPTALGSTNVGAASIIVTNGGTLDVNGQNLGVKPVYISGTGVNGIGAVINGGAAQQNAFQMLTLADNATVGGSNRWDVRGPASVLNLNGYSLTKTGASQVFINNGYVTDGSINVNQGTLSFEQGAVVTNSIGNTNVIVVNGGTLAVGNWGTRLKVSRPIIMNGGLLQGESGSTDADLDSPITLQSNTTFDAVVTTRLTNSISGPGRLLKTSSGLLVLAGSNTYSGGTYVAAGTLQVGTNGIGTLAGDVNLGGVTMVLANTNGLTLNGNITGLSGTVNQYGPSRLTGTNVLGTINVQAGNMANALTLAAGSSNFAVNVNVGPSPASGSLIIEPGAILVANSYMLGQQSGFTGQVTQIGGTVIVTNGMRIGHWPNNISTYLMGGGSLTMTAPPIGVVNPSGATELAGVLYVGVDGVGWLRQTGGVINVPAMVLDSRGATTVGGFSSAYALEGGTLILGSNGLRSGNFDLTTTYQVYLGGGTIGASGNWIAPINVTLSGTNGSLTVDTGSFTNTFGGIMSGPGGLVKNGNGTLLLTSNNTFAGTTLINAGTLGGNGSVAGPVVIGPSALLAPGNNNVGTFTVNNTLTLGGTVVAEISKLGLGMTSDVVRVTTPLTYSGSLVVRALNQAPALAVNDTFRLFDAPGYSGAFSSITLPALPPGLVWNTSRLTVDGSISVAIAPTIVSFTPTSLSLECGTANATFTVAANGTPAPSYQWYKNGVLISGATNTTFAITNAKSADAGSYTVVAGNGAGTATGGPGVLTVNDTTGPSIVVSNITRVLAGASVAISASDVFNAAASSDACSGTATLISATPTVFTCPGVYSVAVKAHDGNGNTNTANATVTIVDVAATNLLAYEPFRCYVDGSLNGQTAAGTGFTGTWATDGGDVLATNSASLRYSSGSAVLAAESGRGVTLSGGFNTAFVGMNTAANGPFGSYVDSGLIGGPAASGTLYFSFVGRNASGDLAGGSDFAGLELYNGTSEVLGVGNNWAAWAYSTFAFGGDYDLTNNAGNYYNMDANPHLFVVKIDYAANADDTVTVWMDPDLTSGEVGQGNLYRRTLTGNAAFNRIALRSGSDNGDNSWEYDEIRFGTSWASVTPAGAAITTQPLSQMVACGGSVSFSVAGAGLLSPTYQWYKNGLALTGQTAATLNIGPASSADVAGYSVTVSTLFGAVTSSVATLTISNVPGLLSPGGSLAIAAETNACGDTTLAAGASYRWEMSDAASTAGTGWDLYAVTGVLDVQATPANPFTINLVSLNGGALGSTANFDNNSTGVWTIATASGGVTGFSADKFALDTTQFANDLGGGAFSVEQGSLNLRFTPNHAPAAADVAVVRAPNLGLKIRISSLLTNASDADSDTLFLYSLSSSTNGATLTTNDTYIFYTNSNNVTDTFTYTVREVRSYRPGDIVRSGVGTITINVAPPSGTNQNVVSWTVDNDGKPHLRFAGIPGYEYDVQRATDLTAPVTWTTVHTTNAPTEGLFDFVDENPPVGQAFYRTAQH